jgi:hypothetical protein
MLVSACSPACRFEKAVHRCLDAMVVVMQMHLYMIGAVLPADFV